jgi:hypothetical protein
VYVVFRQYLVVREVVLVSMDCSLLGVAVASVNTALKCRPDLLTCIINSLFILFTYVVYLHLTLSPRPLAPPPPPPPLSECVHLMVDNGEPLYL